jgi:hypothetical protein
MNSTTTGSLQWRKSSYSGANGQCVEVAVPSTASIAVRDSQNPDGPVLGFSAGAWADFLSAAKGGDFDLS